jgi:hypothetical protein
MKKILFLLLLAVAAKAQTPISWNLMSQNGWRPDVVGGGSNPLDSNQCPGLRYGHNIPCKVFGNIDALWNSVQGSSVKFIRYGGINADQNIPTPSQYLAFVDSARAHGMEPILQIPLNLGETGPNATPAYDTTAAKSIIQFINQTNSRNVIYWSIGNEPDQPIPKAYNYNSKDSAIRITNYIKRFSPAMRRAVPSFPIKILGPELAEWNADPGYTKKKLVDSLLTPGPYKRCDITGYDTITGKPYIDYFTFHYYPFDGDASSANRDTVIARPRVAKGLDYTLDYLVKKIDSANTYHSRSLEPLQVGITEANITYQTISSDALSDVKANGFLAGQYWLETAQIAAEHKVAFINYWSAAEGSMGYMKSDGTKKPTYYHFQMGSNYMGQDLPTADNQTRVKVMTSQSVLNGITVTIMNEELTTKFPYTIYFDSTGSSGSLYINFDAGLTGVTYSSGTDSIDRQTTVQLQFDWGGNLKKKCVYKLYGNADSNLPPTCTEYPIGNSDAYIKGYWLDDGYEPSPLNPWDLYAGDDIWVRNSAASLVTSNPPSYAYEHQHENPEWTNDTAQVPWVYVKVRNRGIDSVSGTLHLYYTRGNLGDLWDTLGSITAGKYGHWTEIGNGKPVALSTTQNGTYAFKWDSIAVQPDPDSTTTSNYNFCLLARFISASDAMNVEYNDTSAGWNAQLNNNVTQKNVILVDSTLNNKKCIIVRNIASVNAAAKLEFEALDQNTQNLLSNGGHVYVELGDSLYSRWAAGGKLNSGVKDYPGEKKIELQSASSYISNISLAQGEEYFICFEFQYWPGAPNVTFNLDAREFLNNVFAGAERFVVPYPDCPQVSASQNTGPKGSIELVAAPNVSGGEYYWINAVGDTISTLQDFFISISVPTTYTVYLRLPNGCVSSTEYTATPGHQYVLNAEPANGSIPNLLLDAVPNPTAGQTRFNYSLEQDTPGEIKIYDLTGRSVGVYSLAANSNHINVNCSDFNNGIYFYTLYLKGRAIGTKKLVITK